MRYLMIKGVPATPAKILKHLRIAPVLSEHGFPAQISQCLLHCPFTAAVRILPRGNHKTEIRKTVPVPCSRCHPYQETVMIFPSHIGPAHLSTDRKQHKIDFFLPEKNQLGPVRRFGKILDKSRPDPPVLMLIEDRRC
jgi:hypothetical protein